MGLQVSPIFLAMTHDLCIKKAGHFFDISKSLIATHVMKLGHFALRVLRRPTHGLLATICLRYDISAFVAI